MSRNDFPIFFMKRSDRLVARLRNMFHGWRFARQVGGQLIMVWSELPDWAHKIDGPDYHIDQLFDLREHYAQGGARDLFFYENSVAFPRDLPSLDGPDFAAMRPAGFDRRYFIDQRPTIYSGHYVRYQFSDENKSTDQLNAEVRDLYRSVPQNPVFARILGAAREKIGSSSYAVLHVRRGDVGGMLQRDLPRMVDEDIDQPAFSLTLNHYLSRTAPFDFYYEPIEACIRDGVRIVFLSDSPETFAHFAKKFGPRQFIDPSPFLKAKIPIQKSFLDFNVMAGATKIITTGSTYSAFAAELGGAELINVSAMGTLERRADFLIEEYVPELAPNVAFRGKLHRKLEALAGEQGG